jgi:hypothetical protein
MRKKQKVDPKEEFLEAVRIQNTLNKEKKRLRTEIAILKNDSVEQKPLKKKK